MLLTVTFPTAPRTHRLNLLRLFVSQGRATPCLILPTSPRSLATCPELLHIFWLTDFSIFSYYPKNLLPILKPEWNNPTRQPMYKFFRFNQLDLSESLRMSAHKTRCNYFLSLNDNSLQCLKYNPVLTMFSTQKWGSFTVVCPVYNHLVTPTYFKMPPPHSFFVRKSNFDAFLSLIRPNYRQKGQKPCSLAGYSYVRKDFLNPNCSVRGQK